MDPKNKTKEFHSPAQHSRANIHILLVKPEVGGNVGAILRAMANMGLKGNLSIVGTPALLDEPCRRLAKHAYSRLEKALFSVSSSSHKFTKVEVYYTKNDQWQYISLYYNKVTDTPQNTPTTKATRSANGAERRRTIKQQRHINSWWKNKIKKFNHNWIPIPGKSIGASKN